MIDSTTDSEEMNGNEKQEGMELEQQFEPVDDSGLDTEGSEALEGAETPLPNEEIPVIHDDAVAEAVSAADVPEDSLIGEEQGDPYSESELEAMAEPISAVDDANDDTEEEELHDESERMIHESAQADSFVDYTGMTQNQLLQAAREANNHTPREAIRRIQEIRTYYLDLLKQSKKDKLREYLEEGGDPSVFEYNDEQARHAINEIYHQAQEARREERERIEKEKAQNVARKEEMLARLAAIADSDETESSLNEVRQIQQEWKKIRVVPAENNQELWNRYHFLLDKFYDNHSINLELKDLDRKHNLGVKIELIQQIEALKDEESLQESFIKLNKYQEDFRNTGPVPREASQSIWDMFRAACDGVYKIKKGLFEAQEAARMLNLEQKQVLVEKAAVIAAIPNSRLKDWNARSAEMDTLFEEWKKIGPVPRSKNDQIWKAFRNERNVFYKNRNDFFQQLHKERTANLVIKEDICKRAEALMDSEDINETTREFIRLQEEWKNTGPVPEKLSNALWKRFRSACDHFFTRKKAGFDERNKEELANLKKKEALIESLKSLTEDSTSSETVESAVVVEKLKQIHQEWSQAGFVPRKVMKEIESAYQQATEAVYRKFAIDKLSAKEGQIEEHYRSMAQMPNGRKRLQDEVIRVQKKVRFLEGEIETWENNIGFFARSRNAEQLRKDIEGKISKARGQLSRLNKEMKVLRHLQNSL